MKNSAELCELISGYFNAFTVGDVEWVDCHVSQDPALRLIGTDPNEWMKGSDGFNAFRREAAAATGDLTAELSHVEAYENGDIGWGAAMVRFTTPTGATAQARFSVVYQLEDAAWKMISSHTSIAIPDAEVFCE